MSESSLLEYAPKRPDRLVDPTLVESDGATDHLAPQTNAGLTPEAVFSRWRDASDLPVRAAIVAPPGAGKTLLLAEFARRIGSARDRNPRTAAELDPLVFFVRSTELPDPIDLLAFVRTKVAQWESQSDQGGLFEPFRRARLIYLLVDGIDEFVTRRDEAWRLDEQLLALQSEGIHVIVSCRENLWFQRYRSRHAYSIIRVRPFDQDQAAQLLREVSIPPGALDHHRHVKKWLLNPMFLRFILDLSQRGGREDFGDSRSKLYENWARKTLGGDITDEAGVEAALTFYGDVAFALVKDRITAFPMSQVNPLLDKCFPRNRPKLDQILNNEVLLEGKDEVRFAHESIYEFFVARSLKAVWMTSANLPQLGLSQVELDYPQSAVYGFLQEFLDKASDGKFEDLVRESMTKHTSASQAWRLARNLIEYLGMIQCNPDTDHETAIKLITVSRDQACLPRVRYNALRALERVHPCAPRPYLRHVSDWGDRDYPDLIYWEDQTEVAPFVMRGHGKKEPEPGRHWAWVPNDPEKPPPVFQASVSHQIGLLLDEVLSSESHEGLSINASHAWIRWFDTKDAALLKKLRKKAGLARKTYVQHNLTLVGQAVADAAP